jgi:ParB/RepB/Spo0J family partition protein
VHSVREFGVLQPVVVRLNDEGKYELIMGERRTRASREAGLTSIPAIVRETADEDLLRDALLENLHRSQLNPLEEASAYLQLLEDFGITQEQLATRIGRSRPQISNTIRLLKLPMPVQQRVAAGVISAGHARAILSLDDADAMQRLSDKIINEDLSVRAAEAVAKGIADAAHVGSPQGGARRAHLDDVAERLGDRLNTKVKITLTARKGQINIDFATVQDLNRILGELGETSTAPQAARRLEGERRPPLPRRASLELLRAEAADELSVLVEERIRDGEDPWDFMEDLPSVDELVVLTLRAENIAADGGNKPTASRNYRVLRQIALSIRH